MYLQPSRGSSGPDRAPGLEARPQGAHRRVNPQTFQTKLSSDLLVVKFFEFSSFEFGKVDKLWRPSWTTWFLLCSTFIVPEGCVCSRSPKSSRVNPNTYFYCVTISIWAPCRGVILGEVTNVFPASHHVILCCWKADALRYSLHL